MTKFEYLTDAIQKHDSDACLIWPFTQDRQGYGKLYRIKDQRAHRLAFWFSHGRMPEPLALHSCDTPACFNPRHIREGTHKDNQGEKAIKGRQVRGEMHKCSKLTPQQILQMRDEHAAGASIGMCSRKYGIGHKTASQIVKHTAWKHIN